MERQAELRANGKNRPRRERSLSRPKSREIPRIMWTSLVPKPREGIAESSHSLTSAYTQRPFSL
jgi:hypothetical protein